MLILQQAKRKFKAPAKMNSYMLGLLAAGVSIPFGLLSAHFLSLKFSGHVSCLAGLVLGSSLFTYTILLTQLIRRQPLFFNRFFPRKQRSPHSINEMSGLRLDYIGGKDPQDLVDGVIHCRTGEIQRILRCKLPHRSSVSGHSLLLEMLFADLCQMRNTRFQIIFPETDNTGHREMLVVASMQIAAGLQPVKTDDPPLVQMQGMLDSLMERLITLGVYPKVMNSYDVRQLISEQLGNCGTRSQVNRDWRNVGNLGWEPSFRETVLKPFDRFMQVSDSRSYTFVAEQIPANGSFEWLSSALDEIPTAHMSIFISPYTTRNPFSKLQLDRKLKKQAGGEASFMRPTTAQMSFLFRFDGRDAYLLETEIVHAKKYLASLGLSSSFHAHRNQQLQNWRSTLPCAQEHSNNKHVIAFMNSSKL